MLQLTKIHYLSMIIKRNMFQNKFLRVQKKKIKQNKEEQLFASWKYKRSSSIYNDTMKNQQLTSYLMVKGWMLTLLRWGTRQGYSFIISSQHCTRSFCYCNKWRKRNKKQPDWNREGDSIFLFFADDTIVYVENIAEYDPTKDIKIDWNWLLFFHF